MALPDNLYRVQYRFNWSAGGSDVEIQETGFWCTAGSGTSDPAEICNILAVRAVNAWSDNMTESLFTAAIHGDEANVYYYPAPPPAHAVTSGRSSFGATPWTGSGVQGLPPQLAMCATTQAYAPGSFVPLRGRRQRGRMYLPTPTSNNLENTGRLKTTVTAALLTAVTGLLNDMTDASGGGVVCTPVIMSLADAEARPISYVRIGDVVDTQRRRRDRLAEVYTAGPTDFPG